MVMIGIDLGTTNSLAVAFVEGKPQLIPNAFGELLTPSVVHIVGGQVTVGQLAKEKLVTAPPGQTAQLFKEYMGSDQTFSLDGKDYTATELSALVVKQLIADAEQALGQKVDEVVISVPAYFNDQQRQATKAIGYVLGIKVERLVNEPSAAALACHTFEDDQTFIVFDFGGGTLDVSVVDCFDNMVSIAAIAGDNHLGGSHFDRALMAYFCEVHGMALDQLAPGLHNTLFLAAERCKLALQTEEIAYLSLTVDGETLGLKISRDLYRQLMQPVLAKVKAVIARAVRDSQLSADEFDAFILVGGSSQMPLVQEFLSELMNLSLKHLPERDQLVAQGLGIYLGIKQREEPVKSLVLTDVCPFSLGVSSYDENFAKVRMVKIISKNTVLPTSASSRFTTMNLGQSQVRFKIYQGESFNPEANLFLAEVIVPVPVNHKVHEAIDVTFSYDLNALLYVEVTILSTQKTHRYRLGQGGELSSVDVTSRLDKIKALSLTLSQEPHYERLLEKAERLYMELPLSYQHYLREMMLSFIEDYRRSSQSLKKTKSILEDFERKLNHLDWFIQGLGGQVFKGGSDDEG